MSKDHRSSIRGSKTLQGIRVKSNPSYLQFRPNADKPDLVLGEAFVPGSDEKHFCQPTSVAVSETTGTFFVADGYCNSRILKYNKDGKLLKIISE